MKKTYVAKILAREKSYLLGETFKKGNMPPLLSLIGVTTNYVAGVNG